ncbi:MFS transporter [Solibacillus sp. FSL W7-1464]|uniref:MFS transporter n=1 Tax=Solibacillus sp. FSL W7-1464 TaxID=2921706 RepID=UPI0030F838E2
MDLRKEYFYLWFGFGASKLGSWIYLIALNLLVWHLTESPAAVAGIYIIGPIARILCSFFAGSIVDRTNKRIILIVCDIFRAGIVCMMPLFSEIWLIYCLIFLANIAVCFANPSSTFMITKLVLPNDRLRFNAINSMLGSGSFMIGPALSGAIIAMSSTATAMWVNGFMLLFSAFMMYLLPNQELKSSTQSTVLTLAVIRDDFRTVWKFISQRKMLLKFFVLYSTALMICFSLDSQEMSFLKDFHEVTDSVYGIIVGITGIGAIVGGYLAARLVKKLSLVSYIGVGFTCTLLSYFIFYFSPNLIIAVAAFILLGLFMAFSNAGYATFYQQTIPTEIMGRFGSSLGLIESVMQIILTLIIGFLAEIYTIQLTTSIFALIGVVIACIVYFHLLNNKSLFTKEELT